MVISPNFKLPVPSSSTITSSSKRPLASGFVIENSYSSVNYRSSPEDMKVSGKVIIIGSSYTV